MNMSSELRRGKLLPSGVSEDQYKNLLFDEKEVKFEFDELAELTFPYPQVSTKVKYAKRRIDNELTAHLNSIIKNQSEGCTQNRVLNQLLHLGRDLKGILNTSQEVIDDKGYDLERLCAKKASFRDDLEYYEFTYIYHYIQQAAIRSVLEFQAHFIDLIPEEKQITIQKIYNEMLHMAVPENLSIQVVENETDDIHLDLNECQEDKMPTNAELFYEEVSKYNFTALPKLAELPENKRRILIAQIAAHPLPYVVAMLDYLGYPAYLKLNYNLKMTQIHKHVQIATNTKSKRSVEGNFNVLNPESKDNMERYTSYSYKEIVKDDYQRLKCK